MSNKDIEYTTVSEVAGPLMIVENIKDVSYNEFRMDLSYMF